MTNFKNVGTWWNDRNIELVEIDGVVYALNEWNGETYLDCWECTGDDNMEVGKDGIAITPIYSEEMNEDEIYDIVGYDVRH